jgi:porin
MVNAADCEQRCGPVQFEASYIHDTWNVARGGLARGTANLGKADVAVGVDGARAFGIEGFTLFARVINDDAGAVTGNFAGDAQGLSNIEAPRATHLVEFWNEMTFGAGSTLRVGLLDLNADFDANDTGSLFINSSHGIGKDFSQSGQAGPSIFPTTSFGARLQWHVPRSAWSIQSAAFDGVPGDRRDPNRTGVSLSSKDGALLVVEADRAGTALKKLALGTWYYTARFERCCEGAVSSGSAGTIRGSSGAYVLSEVQLQTDSGSEQRGVAAFARWGVADDRVNRFGSYAGVGIVRTGVMGESDQIGLAVARAVNGSEWQRDQALTGVPADRAETAFEASYRFSAGRHLSVQPDIQYIVNPNTDSQVANVLAFGLRFELTTSGD